MEDHPRSPSQDCNMFGIGGFCRAYRSLISKRHSAEKNPSPNKPKSKAEDKPESIHETHKASDDKNRGGRAMNGVHESRFNGEGTQADEPASPKGFFKHRSADNYHTSMPSPLSRSSSPTSFSRSANRRSRTPTPAAVASHRLRSMSRKNMDRAAYSDVGVSLSSRNGSTTAFHSGPLSTTAFHSGPLSRTASRKSSTAIMYSNSHGLIKPLATEKNLECTLEELCFGCTKRIMIKRDVVTDIGHIVEEDEMLTIKVKPGWRKGTKITFEGMGNETRGTHPADIIFVIAEKRHPLFRREGDDLELAVEIPLVQALTGCALPVPLLGGEKMSLRVDDIIQPGYEKIIAGQGMPKSKEQGNRGNLIIKFLVEFPIELTDEQRADVFSILQDSC